MVDSAWLWCPLPDARISKEPDFAPKHLPENLRTGKITTRRDGGPLGIQVGEESHYEKGERGEAVEVRSPKMVAGLYGNSRDKDGKETGRDWSLDISTFGVSLKIHSLPRLVKSEAGAIDPVSPIEAVQGFDRVRGELSDRGVEIPSEMFLTRCDLFKNLEVSNPPVVYSNLLRSLGGTRGFSKQYGDTTTFGGSQRQVGFYDKVSQMADKYDVDLRTRGNVLRAEYRALQKKVVQRDVKVITTGDLVRHWNDLPKKYSALMKVMIFNREDIGGEVAEIYERLTAYRERVGGKRWIHQAIYLIGLERIAGLSREERRELFVALGGRYAFHRIEAAIKEAGVFVEGSARAQYAELLRLVA